MGLVGCTRLPAGAPPVPLRLLLLSACCAALLARGCVRAASTSAGPTSAHWYNASAHVLVSWSSCPLPVSCKPLADFDVTDHASGEHTDRERIVLCDGPLPGGRASARHTGSSSPPALAICVPVVFGRVSPAWLDDWLSWWTHLGASHATIYSMDVPEPRLANAVAANQLTWVDVSWLAAYDTHSHGQAWAMHDCLFRARTRGVRWAFFVDVDELLFIAAPGGSNATALLEAAAAASVRSLGTTGGNGSGSWRSANVVTFASVPYNTDVCDDDDSSSLPARMRFRAPSAECAPGPEDWDAKGWPRDTQCLGWAGRRKFAARVAEIDTMSVHIEHYLTDEHTLLHAPSHAAFLKHARGAASSAELCRGELAAECTRTTAATLRCPSAFGGPLFVHEDALSLGGRHRGRWSGRGPADPSSN